MKIDSNYGMQEKSELHKQGLTVQKKLLSSKQKNSDDVAKVFARLMLQGKTNAALKFLTDRSDQGLLPVNDDILRELRLKHPQPVPIQPNILLNGPLEQVPTNYFDSIMKSQYTKQQN